MSERGYLHRRSTNFGKVPFELMTDSSVTAGAVRLYAYLHWRYGSNCDNHESRASMASALGVSKATITKYLAELEHANWIIIIRRKGKQGGATNFYHVFELQDECTAWRKAHGKQKPSRNVGPRKARAGVGGKPTHKTKDNTVNSSLPSYRGSDEVNSSLPTSVNSSLANPDSVDPDKYFAASPPRADSPKPRARSARQAALDDMVESMVTALHWTRETVTDAEWGLLRKAGSELRKVGATPSDMAGLATWCNKQGWTSWGPRAMSMHWSDYVKTRPTPTITNAEPTPHERIMARAIEATQEDDGER